MFVVVAAAAAAAAVVCLFICLFLYLHAPGQVPYIHTVALYTQRRRACLTATLTF